jgi:hypothetical protein
MRCAFKHFFFEKVLLYNLPRMSLRYTNRMNALIIFQFLEKIILFLKAKIVVLITYFLLHLVLITLHFEYTTQYSKAFIEVQPCRNCWQNENKELWVI